MGTMFENKELTYLIRACVFEVYRELGHGYLEKLYEQALFIELQRQRLRVQKQVPLTVDYKGVPIGKYSADRIVEDSVIVELKAQEQLSRSCEAQLLHYLKMSGVHLGLLVNFAYPKATIKRLVF
jgi:GxxExxY protein